jgi:hypothetical protein
LGLLFLVVIYATTPIFWQVIDRSICNFVLMYFSSFAHDDERDIPKTRIQKAADGVIGFLLASSG